MLDWLRRRRLSASARKKLLIATARAEEALVETHVSNILAFLSALGDEVDLDRTIELYLEQIPLEETLATTVTTRLLARLESPRSRGGKTDPRFKDVFREGGRR